jgi:hypothetical protein
MDVFLHERRNGRFLLPVTGHPTYGLPWGQDRLVPFPRHLGSPAAAPNDHVPERP